MKHRRKTGERRRGKKREIQAPRGKKQHGRSKGWLIKALGELRGQGDGAGHGACECKYHDGKILAAVEEQGGGLANGPDLVAAAPDAKVARLGRKQPGSE
jgi:hypothetical protein